MECLLFWSTYCNSISHVRITFRHADSCDEGASPRLGSAFTIDYCKRFPNLSLALEFLTELNSKSSCYIQTILPKPHEV